jgi:hypothetical protein
MPSQGCFTRITNRSWHSWPEIASAVSADGPACPAYHAASTDRSPSGYAEGHAVPSASIRQLRGGHTNQTSVRTGERTHDQLPCAAAQPPRREVHVGDQCGDFALVVRCALRGVAGSQRRVPAVPHDKHLRVLTVGHRDGRRSLALECGKAFRAQATLLQRLYGPARVAGQRDRRCAGRRDRRLQAPEHSSGV